MVMERFFKNHVPYKTVCILGKALGIHQKCPYVIGDIQFTPDSGVTKHNANWIGMHHVLNIEGDQSSTQLQIANHHELSIPLSMKMLLTMVHNTSKLYHTQYKLSQEWDDLFIENLSPEIPLSIVKKMHVDILSKSEMPSAISWHTRLRYSISKYTLCDLMEEGDPYV